MKKKSFTFDKIFWYIALSTAVVCGIILQFNKNIYPLDEIKILLLFWIVALISIRGLERATDQENLIKKL